MSSQQSLRALQILALLAGVLLAVAGVFGPAAVAGSPTVELSLVALALALVAAAGAARASNRDRQTALSLSGGALLLVVAVGSGPMALAGSALLGMVGLLLLVDSLDRDRLRE
jgi:hypothetical protein